MKRYNTPHRSRVVKTRMTEEEYAAFAERLSAYHMSQAELSAIFKRLYEDSVTGRISGERFTELSADYEAEQRELKEKAAAIRAELSKAQEGRSLP